MVDGKIFVVRTINNASSRMVSQLGLLSSHTGSNLPPSCAATTHLTTAPTLLRQRQLVVDYFGYSARLVLAKKLVESGSHASNN
jgi:hypothetical protein